MESGTKIRVNATRRLAGVDMPLWCNGKTGVVVKSLGELVIVKLDGVSSRELMFRSNELERDS